VYQLHRIPIQTGRERSQKSMRQAQSEEAARPRTAQGESGLWDREQDPPDSLVSTRACARSSPPLAANLASVPSQRPLVSRPPRWLSTLSMRACVRDCADTAWASKPAPKLQTKGDNASCARAIAIETCEVTICDRFRRFTKVHAGTTAHRRLTEVHCVKFDRLHQ
jgi:hypothetical protein